MTRVLFVCIENANRSQMAEAFARSLGGGRVEAYSAGSRPSGRVNPAAIEAMRELGYDLNTHRSKSLDEIAGVEFDAVVTMGCGDACPHVPAKRREDWSIPDPRGMSGADLRAVRDRIADEVRSLLARLAIDERGAPVGAAGTVDRGGAPVGAAGTVDRGGAPAQAAVSGVLETCLYAKDLDAAERFYTEVIGLRVIARQAGRHVFFRCGRGVFLVFDPDATAGEPLIVSHAKIPPHGAHGPGHAAFAVDEASLPAWREHLARLRVAIEAEVSWPGGGESIYVRDPAGNSIELATPRLWAPSGDSA